MLRLTPLEETTSGQELIKNERVSILTALIQDKFNLPDTLIKLMRSELDKLEAEALSVLVHQILHFDTYEELENWIADQQLTLA